MLKLFKALFGSEPAQQGRYSDAIVGEGMALALDATDTRIRTLPGYEARLRPAVLATFDHVVALVDGLPATLDLTRESYAAEARMAAFFTSAQHIQQVMRDDQGLLDWLEGPEGRRCSEVHALLMMHLSERKVLGMELQGEIMRREVAQVAVSFGHHRFLAPAESADACRRRLYRRAYNHILQLALERIVADRNERAGLQQQRGLLQTKLKALAAGRWGLDDEEGEPAQAAQVEREIEQLDRQLAAIGGDGEVLNRHLDILCEVLGSPQRQIWAEPLRLTIDRMGIKREAGGANHLELDLQVLRGAKGRSAIPQRVRVPRMDFPRRPDFLSEAARYLG